MPRLHAVPLVIDWHFMKPCCNGQVLVFFFCSACRENWELPETITHSFQAISETLCDGRMPREAI